MITNTNNRMVNNLIIFVILFSSITGLTLVDFTGMNFFWVVFVLTSMAIMFSIIKKDDLKKQIKLLLTDKFNILLIIYLFWTGLSYMTNYQGRPTLLYIFKMWFIIVIYTFVFNVYISKLGQDDKDDFIIRLCKWIFILGTVHTFFGFYQYLFLSNNFLGFILTDWPPYNPASMYGNVNGLGTYLFLSIVSGIIYFKNTKDNRSKQVILFILTAQAYMLYLTISRTSIIVTLVYIVFNLIALTIKDKKRLKTIFNKTNIKTILAANLIFILIIQYSSILSFISQFDKYKINLGNNANKRSTVEMLEEKNGKGVNQRQFIWKAVIKDYKDYMLVGDGLKYEIVNKINVEKVISEKSKGATRISYHNTLFRYFASNGLLGLIIFLLLYSYMPIMLLIKMLKEKKISLKYMNIIIFMACIFLYMQMEEVYLGEVGFIQIITLISMVIGNRFIIENRIKDIY